MPLLPFHYLDLYGMKLPLMQEENKLSKKKDKKKDKLIKKKKQQKMLKISHMFKIQLKRLMTFLIKGKLTKLPTHLRCVRLQV